MVHILILTWITRNMFLPNITDSFLMPVLKKNKLKTYLDGLLDLQIYTFSKTNGTKILFDFNFRISFRCFGALTPRAQKKTNNKYFFFKNPRKFRAVYGKDIFSTRKFNQLPALPLRHSPSISST